jgi:hypothetical protein
MAKAYGSTGRPVVLDPFRRIVEVHWRDNTTPPLAFAFIVRLGAVVRPIDGPAAEVAPIYYSPFGNPNTGFYHPDVSVPTSWAAYVLTEKEGWIGAASHTITGLPAFGTGPLYEIGSFVALEVFPYALSLKWVDPTGDVLDFVSPVTGNDGVTPNFKAGAASVTSLGGGSTSLLFPTDITVEAGAYSFAYAGAVSVPITILDDSNELVGDRQLMVLCLPVTA